jgi:hypothetical protein
VSEAILFVGSPDGSIPYGFERMKNVPDSLDVCTALSQHPIISAGTLRQ